jgi:hypothetical protein
MCAAATDIVRRVPPRPSALSSLAASLHLFSYAPLRPPLGHLGAAYGAAAA